MSLTIFNSLPDYLVDLVCDKQHFIKEVKDILMDNLSDTVYEFLCLCRDQQ
jgi:hypothetical protein